MHSFACATNNNNYGKGKKRKIEEAANLTNLQLCNTSHMITEKLCSDHEDNVEKIGCGHNFKPMFHAFFYLKKVLLQPIN